MHLTFIRLASAAALGGLALATISAGRARDVPLPVVPESVALPAIPTAPTIPPPVAPTGPHVRFHNLIPQEKNGEKVGDKNPLPPAVVESGPELSLAECIAVALERQPSLKAVRASGAATAAGAQSLANFGTVGTLISPDLNIRKQQAQRGLAASAAEYQKAHNEVVQDVTRLYYSAVYAKQQEAIAAGVVGDLKELVDIAWDILNKATNIKELEGLTRGKILAMEIGLREAREKHFEARIGRQRALAALRQMMAVDEKTFPFRVKDTELPVMEQKITFTKDQVVELTLCRRPELALAAAGVDAFRLEVYAQGKIPFKRVVPTFASGSDLHAKEIPPAMRGKEYRPGAVGPELPPQLVGSKTDRVNRAMAYSQRAEAVFESVRGLVTLEAENTYLEFEFATERVKLAKEKLDLALDVQKTARLSAPNIKDKSVLVQAEVLAAKSQADYVTAVYDHLLMLSVLERVTAGGIRPAFPGR